MFETLIHDAHRPHFTEASVTAFNALIPKEEQIASLFEKHGIDFIQVEPALTIFDKESPPYSLLVSVRKHDGSAIDPRVLSHLEAELSHMAGANISVGSLSHRTIPVPLRTWANQNEIWDDLLAHDTALSDAAINDLKKAESYYGFLNMPANTVPGHIMNDIEHDARAMHIIQYGEAAHQALQHVPKTVAHTHAPAAKTLVYLRNYLAHPEQFDDACEALLSSDHAVSSLLQDAYREIMHCAELPELAAHHPKITETARVLSSIEKPQHLIEDAVRFRELRAGRFLGEVSEYLKYMDLPGLEKKLYSFTGHANDIAHGGHNGLLSAHPESHVAALEKTQLKLKQECYGITPEMRRFGATQTELAPMSMRSICHTTRHAEIIPGAGEAGYTEKVVAHFMSRPTMPQRTGRAMQKVRAQITKFTERMHRVFAHAIHGNVAALNEMGLEDKLVAHITGYIDTVPKTPELLEWAKMIEQGASAKTATVASVAIGPNRLQRLGIVSEVLATLPEDALTVKRKLKPVLMSLEVPDASTLRAAGLEAASILKKNFHPAHERVATHTAEVVRLTLQRIGHCPEGLAHFLDTESIAARAVIVASKAIKR